MLLKRIYCNRQTGFLQSFMLLLYWVVVIEKSKQNKNKTKIF